MQNIPTIASIATNKTSAFKAANVNSLLSVSADSKTIKGEKSGYLTGILCLAPHNNVTSSKVKTVCPSAIAAGCAMACLYTAGRGRFDNVKNGRIKRTESFLANEQTFMIALWYDVLSLIKKAYKADLEPVVRLNGTSDIDYQNIVFTNPNGETGNIFEMFPAIQFYDYSKNTHTSKRELPANYTVTYSYSGYSTQYASKAYYAAKRAATGLAVVFRKSLPESFLGLPVIDGDSNDLRFLDKQEHGISGPYIVGLKAKGEAKKDHSGFVINNV